MLIRLVPLKLTKLSLCESYTRLKSEPFGSLPIFDYLEHRDCHDRINIVARCSSDAEKQPEFLLGKGAARSLAPSRTV
jgi:hypothetical protein